MEPEYRYCQKFVQRHDKDRFLTALFAPASRRPALFALYAFNAEVARVRDLVSDPFPGEMRYQWWRDALSGVEHGNVRNHPIARAMIDTVAKHDLPEPSLSAFLEARTLDLYDDPINDLQDLERYCAETAGALILLASHILAGPAGRERARNAAFHAGVATGLTAVMRAFPYHIARGQVFLPVNLLERAGITARDVLARRCTAAVRSVLAELGRRARFHLDRLNHQQDALPIETAPALLPACLVEGYLREMERRDHDPFETVVEIAQWRRQLTIWRAARRARRGGRGRRFMVADPSA